MSLWRRLANSTWRLGRAERESRDDLDAHVEASAAALEDDGWSSDEARAEAQRRLGLRGTLVADASSYDTLPWLVTLVRDTRHAWRALRRQPALVATAVLTLGGGLGLALAALSLIDGILLRPLPFPDPQRLVVLEESIDGRQIGGNPARVADWDRELTTFGHVAGLYGEQVVLATSEGARLAQALRGIGPLAQTLDLRPAAGRLFTPDEERDGAAVVVLTDKGWSRLFGRRPDVIGASVRLRGTPFDVVGVLPAEVDYPDDVDLIAPAGPAYQQAPRGGSWLLVVGRLAPGVALTQASDEVNALAGRFATRYPDHDRGLRVRLVALQEHELAGVRPALLMVVASTGALLAVVCLNLGGLLLVRAVGRDHETAIRRALGASRWSLVRSALHEALWLTVPGMVLGWLVARQLLAAARVALAGEVPRLAQVGLDGRSLAIAALLTVSVAVALAAWPAWHVARRRTTPRVAGHAVTDDTSRRWLRQGLVAAQVTCGTALLVLALLLGRSLDAIVSAPGGFRTADTLQVRYDLDWERPKADVDALAQRVYEVLSTVPGVEAVGLGDRLPLQGGTQSTSVRLYGEAQAPPSRAEVSIRTVTGDYLTTLGVPVLAGRVFPAGIQPPPARDEVVVNETFARTTFGRLDVVGERIAVDWSTDEVRWRSIVGVVGDLRQSMRQTAQPAAVFQPWSESGWPLLHFVVRTDGTADVLSRVAAALRTGIPDVPAATIGRLDAQVAALSTRERLLTRVMTAAAVTAAVLAVLGLYGVLVGDLQARRREIGIRLALGARPWRLRGRLLRGALIVTVLGTLGGVALSVPAARAAAALLYGVEPVEPGLMAIAAVVLTLATLVVSVVPAWRSVNGRALRTLRHE